MRTLELRRHADRAKGEDALSPEGRIQAEDLGRSLTAHYDIFFVSPARRAAETMAWILRGSRHQLGSHAVVPGLGSELEDRWRSAATDARSGRVDAIMAVDPRLVDDESARLATVVRDLFGRIPDGGSAMAVGHTPLIEAAVYGLLGLVIDPLAPCEGVLLTLDDGGDFRVQELRLPDRS
jgi:broad specificity phosphatase PhoE